MPTKESQFRQRLVDVVRNLTTEGRDDPEAMLLLGALAASIIDDARVKSWAAFKPTLTREAYDTMLKTFEKQGNQLVKDGKMRAAYAVQALALSVIARTQSGPEVKAAEAQLDAIIDRTVDLCRSARMPGPAVH